MQRQDYSIEHTRDAQTKRALILYFFMAFKWPVTITIIIIDTAYGFNLFGFYERFHFRTVPAVIFLWSNDSECTFTDYFRKKMRVARDLSTGVAKTFLWAPNRSVRSNGYCA